MKIVLLGLWKNTNLGDLVIADCTRYLVDQIVAMSGKNVQVEHFDIMMDDYSVLSKYNIMIFVGGGIIKYAYQNFYTYIDEITKIADENHAKVLFVGVGVEGYCEENHNCIILKNALNRDCVRYISVRDDIDTLRQKYVVNGNIVTEKVSDPAVFASKVYGIQKYHSNVVGIGVIREGIFRSNGIDIGREEMVILYKGIIEELEKRKYDWRIFTNGWSSDMKFAKNLMLDMQRENEICGRVLEEPRTGEELVERIAGFSAVIAARLHANIISYSLDIPSIGIVWNDKLKYWGKNINCQDRFFEISRFSPVAIVEEMERAITIQYKQVPREKFDYTVYDGLRKALFSILT